MNIATLAQSVYSDARAPTRTERATEYQVFARITRRLSAAGSQGEEKFPELVAAVHDNRRLWNILAIDVANSDNALPAALRAQIFYLAEFTESHSAKVLSREQDASALIDINMAVMRGLFGPTEEGT